MAVLRWCFDRRRQILTARQAPEISPPPLGLSRDVDREREPILGLSMRAQPRMARPESIPEIGETVLGANCRKLNGETQFHRSLEEVTCTHVIANS